MFDLSERREPGRRSRRAATAMLTAVVVCLAATGCSAVKSAVNSAASRQGPQPTAAGSGASSTGLKLLAGAPAASAASGTGGVLPPDPLGPPADPFTGTPADHWADGAAGIVLPAAEPIGPYTKAQVKYAYETTRELLIAAELDKQTLLGGAPTAFADLLTSQQRATFLSGLNKVGLDKEGRPMSTRSWVMSFPPGAAQLIGSVIKVRGSMYAKATRSDSGYPQLSIYTDYTFVYPVEPPHHPNDWMRIVNEVAWTMQFGDWQGADSQFAPWLTWDGTVGGVSGANCGTADGYQHPAYPVSAAPGPAPSVSPSGKPVDPYVAGQTRQGDCEATTGT